MDTNKLLPLLSEMGVFVKVVELGSFSKAAIHLGTAPSSISRTITKLEQALEEKLLERTTRQMHLTPKGEIIFAHCRDMLNTAQTAVSAAYADKTDISGILRVAAPKAFSRQVLMPLIFQFRKTHPNVSIHLKVADHVIDPIGNEVDVLIHITQDPILGLVAKRLGHCKMKICASQAYIEQKGIPHHPSDLAQHNCICLGETPKDSVWTFNRESDVVKVNVKGSFSVNHSEIRREAILQDIGISLFPDFAIQEQISSGQVVELLPDWRMGGSYQGEIVAQYAQSRYVPTQILGFVDYLNNHFNEMK
ncbi:LysR substrate-binding domain-containing protein [Vibrio sp. RC27]